MTEDPIQPKDPAPAVGAVHLPTRSRTYLTLVAIVAGMLTLGLLVPIVAGERTDDALEFGAGDPLDLDGLGDDGFGPGSTVPGDTTTTTASGGAGGAGGAGGSAGAGGDGGSGPSGPGSSVPLTASDVGVTAEAIRVGLLVPTSDAIGSTGDQTSVQQAEVEAFTEEINARGGIHGRSIEVVVESYDILDQDAGARAACLSLVDDQKVFAVFNTTGFGPPGALCLTREKGVPFLQGSGHPEEVYGQAQGLYSSTFDNQTRNFRNMVGIADRLGALEGKKVGVLGTEWLGLRREQEDGIVKTLQARGYDPFVYWLGGDPVSSQAQIPIAILQMRNAGVEVVMLGADFISGQSFVSLGNTQGFRPRYVAADPWGYSTDYVVAGMPASFQGALAVTAMRTHDKRAGLAEPALDAQCAQIVRDATGLTLDRGNDPDALYSGSMLACGVVRRFEAAALAAGPNLTRAGLAQAIANLGTLEVPFAGGPATYSANKLDGADHYRAQQWEAGCKCWNPLTSAFQIGEYR